MENCPLKGKLKNGIIFKFLAYPKGLGYVKLYLQRKYDRIYYKVYY